MARCAFLGLGVMGFPMAGHLVRAGHEVTVYNRTTQKARDWVDTYGGGFAHTPAEAVEGAEFVMSCVGNDNDLRMICTGAEGAFSGMTSGSIFVDHTTVSAEVPREMHEAAAARQISFVDAPVSGGQGGATTGVLSVMCGGAQADFDRAEALNPVGYKIALELIVKCDIENVAEVPIHFADRIHGESKLTLKEQLKYIQCCITHDITPVTVIGPEIMVIPDRILWNRPQQLLTESTEISGCTREIYGAEPLPTR